MDEKTPLFVADSSFSKLGKKTSLGPLSLVALVYFLVCGGAYGTEDLGGTIPPLYAMIGIVVIPWIWSLPLALITAELSMAIPDDGGFLAWISRAMGRFWGFLDGWNMLLVAIIDQAVYPLIFTSYLDSMIPLSKWQEYIVSVSFTISCCAWNFLGVGAVGHSSKILSTLAVFPFVIFVIMGFFSPAFQPENLLETKIDREADIALYTSVLIWATCGFEYAGFMANEVKNARSTFPVVMLVAVVLMMLTYLLPIGMALATWNNTDTPMTDGMYPDIAENLGFGSWVSWLMVAGGLGSSLGTYNAYLMTSSTALQAMSIKGEAPKFFSYFPEFKVPIIPLLFYTATTIVLVYFDFSVLVEIESFLFCFHSILLAICFMVLRFREPNLERPFSVPITSTIAILPICFALFNVIYGAYYAWYYLVIAACVALFGSIIFFLKERRLPFSNTLPR